MSISKPAVLYTPDRNVLIGTTTDYTSTEKAGAVTIDGIATRNVIVGTGLSGTQSNTSLIVQNATPFNGGNGSTNASTVGIYVAPTISNDGSGGSNSVFTTAVIGNPIVSSASVSARISLNVFNGNSLRNSANDFSTNASNFLSATQTTTGHGPTLPNTALTNNAIGVQGTVANNSGTINTSSAALFRNSCGNASAAQVNTSTTVNGVNADLLLGHATAGASSITDYYAFRSTSTINASGTLTNFYGLHIGTPTVTGTLTNKWAIYTTDANMKSYFAGSVGIGTTNPANIFSVVSATGQTGLNAGTVSSPVKGNLWYDTDGSGWKFQIGKWQSSAFTAQMTFQDDGNVGIGTTSPTTRLQVDDTYGGYRAGIVIKNTADGATGRGTGIEWHSGTGTTKGEIALTAIDATQNGYDMKFLTTATGGSKTTKMTITGAGNVGIGTTSPSAKLHVSDASASNSNVTIQLTNTQSSKNLILGSSATAFAYQGIGNNDSFVLSDLSDLTLAAWNSSAIKFVTGTTEKMRLTSAGNVGIGTDIPTAYSGYTTLAVNGSTNGAVIEFQAVKTQYARIVGTGGGLFFNTSNNDRMTITSAGNVGIGTTNPLNSLQILKNQTSDTAIIVSNVGTSSATTSMSFVLQEAASPQGWLRRYRDGSGLTEIGYTNDLAFSGNVASTKTEHMRITSAGYLLVGYTTSNGAYPLQVNGQIFATSSTIATSDGRYKKDVVALDGALDIVKALNPVQFSWKNHPVHKFNTDVPTVGFIAQEVAEVLKDKAYLTSLIKKSECTWETETGEIIEREITRDVEKQVTREVEREITETIDGEEVTRTITEEVTETIIEQVTEIVQEPVKETHTEEFLGIAESNLIAILTKAVKELTAKVEALEAQLNGN